LGPQPGKEATAPAGLGPRFGGGGWGWGPSRARRLGLGPQPDKKAR
jgi:hypothetical protein